MRVSPLAVAPLLLVAVLGFGLWLLCAMRPAYPNQLSKNGTTCVAIYGSNAQLSPFSFNCWSSEGYAP